LNDEIAAGLGRYVSDLTCHHLHPRAAGNACSVRVLMETKRSKQGSAAQIMAEWGAEGRHLAHLGLLLDYGYMLSYGLFFALAGFSIRDAAQARGWGRMARAGIVVPYFALAAACFDASENIALLLTLGGHGGSFAPPFATVCSSVKWMLIGTAILYVLCGVALLLWARLFGAGQHQDASDPGI
jgi:hypothetical protein